MEQIKAQQAEQVKSGRLKPLAAAIGVAATTAMTLPAHAAIVVPTELTDVFVDLAAAFGTLMAAGAVLFGIIRGGVALFKLASRVFSAAGA